MTDRPIIFSAPMVKALLAGRKTMTRRLASSPLRKCEAGDRLWVREGWKPHSIYSHLKPSEMPQSKVFYLADKKYEPSNTPGKPSIHMPRWASRLTLVITGIKVERLQDISEADAQAEGIEYQNIITGSHGSTGVHCEITADRYFNGAEDDDFEGHETAGDAFENLWTRLYGQDAWDANPEVVALSFRVEKINIDALEARAA